MRFGVVFLFSPTKPVLDLVASSDFSGVLVILWARAKNEAQAGFGGTDVTIVKFWAVWRASCKHVSLRIPLKQAVSENCFL